MLRSNFFVLHVLLIFSFSSLSAQVKSKPADPPLNWHMLSPDDGIFGVEADKAYDYLSATKRKAQKIIVAVIDADLDTRHEEFEGMLWTNTREKMNGRDDDNNGYVDDIHGWNFLGNNKGENLSKAGSEAFREYKRLRPRYEKDIDPASLTEQEKQEYAYFLGVRKESKIASYLKFTTYLQEITNAFTTTDSVIRQKQYTSSVTVGDVMRLQVQDSSASKSQKITSASLWKYEPKTLWKDAYARQKEESDLAFERIKSLDEPGGPRDVIGDNIKSLADRHYGNNNIRQEDSNHGTFVAALIGARRNNNKGIDGIADKVAIMGIRAVPDGDEYDKDVALSIRYAVDNGAKIINMSFGKYISPDSKWVDSAVAYAVSKNVLLIHAAGNEGKNIDSAQIYPSGLNTQGQRASYFLRVGASTPEGDAANLSNYGKANVDIFAPGVKIYSASTNNSYTKADGTSAAAPIVSGVAALVWSYFPELSAEQLREVLLRSVTSRKGHRTPVPGKKGKEEDFADLSVSGGIVNAYQAIQMAEALTKRNK